MLTLKGDGSSYGGGGQINIIGGNTDYMYYATNIMRSGSPNINEARESYDMLGHTWAWDGNMGNTAFQPYTSYDFKSQGSSQMVIYNNNVGIGTTNPQAKLQVSNSGESNLDIEDTGGQRYRLFSRNSDKVFGMYDVSNPKTWFRYTGNATISSTKLALLEGGGNVGIGTTSPNEKLVIKDSTSNTGVKILSYNNAIGTEATLKFATVASDVNYVKAAIITRNYASSFGRSDMHFALDSAADSGNVQFSDTKMTILNNGNVGIGTISPRTKLHVTGLTGDDDPALGSSTAPFFVSNTANSYGLNIGVNNAGASWLQSQSNTSSTAYNLLLNPLGGNVGMGTTSPRAKLDVNGGIKLAKRWRSTYILQSRYF